MKIFTSKNSLRFFALVLALIVFVPSFSFLAGLNIFADSTGGQHAIVTVDFENNVVANNYSNVVSGRPSTLVQTGSLATNEFYQPNTQTRKTSGNYWVRSSWAIVTSDANPKYTDTSYDWANNNEYMKLTYVYQPKDLCSIERSETTAANYTKAGYPNWYKDYAFNPGFLLPERTDTYNYKSSEVKAFSGEEGKEYRITIDVALVEDDDKKVELYAMPVVSDGSTDLSNFTGILPSEANGDILICSTEATDDKKLEVQSKSGYAFKTYEFVYTAVSGKTPFIVMVTNDGETINAEQGHNFACAYVDNINIYDEYEYIKSAKPDGTLLSVKYEAGTRLADIETTLIGYKHDGKWYDDFDCTTVSIDEYPAPDKIYYRKWVKYFTLDFNSEYFPAGSSSAFYRDPISDRYVNGTGQYWVYSSFFALRDNRILMTYWNDNPTNVNYQFYPRNYLYSPVIKIFDPFISGTFTGSPNFEYKISFDYEVLGPVPEEDVSVYLYLTPSSGINSYYESSPSTTSSIVVGKFDVNIADGAKGRTPEFTFTAKMGYTPQIVMVTNDGVRLQDNPSQYHTLFIDNLTVEEIYPEGKSVVAVSFDSDGGSDVSGFRVIKGDPIGTLPTPTKSGYLFDCWYIEDDDDKEEVNSSYIPIGNIKLKAKWVSVTAANYGNSELDNFDEIRYPNILENYADLDFATLLDNGVADSTMTAANRYIKEGCPNNMGSALLLSNKPFAMSNAKSGISAVALLNKDGTKFTVKKGTRYKVEFDYLPLGESSAHTYIRMIYGSYTADTIDASNVKGIFNVPAHGLDSETHTVTQYFSASQDGFVFFTLGSRQNFDSSEKEHFVLLDNVRITIESNVKSVTFANADGSSLGVNPYGFSTQYGLPGDKIRTFGFTYIQGKQLEGFYNDQECTEPCTDYNVITNKDRTVYVKFKDVDYSTLSDFTNPITLDFENSEDLDLELLYRYRAFADYQSTESENTVNYIADDAENANGGTGYMRIKDIKYVYGGSGHSFVLYDKNNPSGIMMFEPNTSYRITAQVKYEDDAQAPLLRFWWVDPTTNTHTRDYDINLTTKNDDPQGYVEISAVFTVGENPTAIAIGGVYLAEQDVYIDDIKVEKMNYYTIKFETNGGDKIDDIVTLPYTDLASLSPGFAFKPGYEFVGWYLDPEFTKPFDFLTDYITGNVTLYAKYIKEPVEEETEENNIEIFEDIIVDEIIEDEGPKFGNQLKLLEAEPVAESTAKVVNEKPISIWYIVIASLGALIISGGAVTVLLIIRRRKV